MLTWRAQVDGAATPGWAGGETPAVGATPKRGRSRWDETPAGVGVAPGATPMIGATPLVGMTPMATPMGGMDMATPSPASAAAAAAKVPLTAEQYQVWGGCVRGLLQPCKLGIARSMLLRLLPGAWC